MVADTASLKMAFDAEMESFLRIHLRRPPRPRFAASPELCAVYARAYELAARRAATFDEADDPSLVSTPPEFDAIPFAEAWSKGIRAGDWFGRLMRGVILESVAEGYF